MKQIFLNFIRMRARSRAWRGGGQTWNFLFMVFIIRVYLCIFACRVTYSWKSSRGMREKETGEGGGEVSIHHKNRRSSQSPCCAPLIIHVESKTRRQQGSDLGASKNHFFFSFFFFYFFRFFFFFFFYATKIPYADKSWLFDRGFLAPGSIFYLQSHTLDHACTFFPLPVARVLHF